MKVVNLRNEKYDVYIGRGSPFGNPFKIGIDGTRLEVIEKYKHHLAVNTTQRNFMGLNRGELRNGLFNQSTTT